ncbi:MAG: electron transfer flavoprotein subunit beta/FixA family protein [Actinobacteria bacterium]|nr:electron transfer flavoprotein subunit beta/FixA family protein [Actinomycetota bacterium]MCG2818146.1 electron transfer flavoprotein subunit beta/FixA family protein [Actinomycetes bacterium]MBU4217524.1 electron transfer flavoprotein subunit beta/FixA family protein [Actinomycetota bacterium]MBU4359805.1 electron transfer flavoprotein subunit beta/FixA family protein [Actinomycetota bacterium]MBU4391355.1 electron transfer flavoprotein subunit beta/FixA family protein [Actinomycetota bacte
MAEGLRIIVCVKQVPDPEGPPSAFEVDTGRKTVTPRGIPPVISPFDENALEAAIRLKDAHGCTVTLLSMGSRLSTAVFLKAIAVGVDESYLVEDPLLEPDRLDGYITAHLLAAAIKRTGAFDLILTGRQAADTNAGIVGLGIAEILGIPAVTLAQGMKLEEDTLRVERVLPDGHEVVRVPLPALVTVSHEIGELRYPRISDIKSAKGRPQTRWNLDDICAESLHWARVRLDDLYTPSRQSHCILVEGENPEDAGSSLAVLLRNERIL